MSSVLEYTYDEIHPLEDKEVVQKYREEKAINPDALVVIDDLGCGVHYVVKTYHTQREKEEFLAKKIEGIWARFTDRFLERVKSIK